MGVCGETFKNGVGALNNCNKQEQLNCQKNFGTCLLVLVLMLLINFVVGPWLWNNVLKRLVPSVGRARWYDTVALALLLGLIIPH